MSNGRVHQAETRSRTGAAATAAASQRSSGLAKTPPAYGIDFLDRPRRTAPAPAVPQVAGWTADPVPWASGSAPGARQAVPVHPATGGDPAQTAGDPEGVSALERLLGLFASGLTGWTLRRLMPARMHAALARALLTLRVAFDVERQPARFLDALRTELAVRIERAAAQATNSALALLPAPSDSFDARKSVTQRLAVALRTLREGWWEVLWAMGRELIWPWPALAGDFAAIRGFLRGLHTHLAAREWSRLLDDVLAILRQLNAVAGRLYGWFVLGVTLGGALLGGVAGAALGAGVGVGAGVMAGAGAGLAVAGVAGAGLLATTVAIEGASIAKARNNLASADRLPEEKEGDCEVIVSSSLTLAISLAMSLIGALGARFARLIVRRSMGSVRGPSGRRTSLWDRSLDRRAGGRPQARGDVLAERFSLAEATRLAFRRRRLVNTDALTTRANFPGIDLAAGSKITMRSRKTGRLLTDARDLHQAFARRERMHIDFEGGDVHQVKSHRATTASGESAARQNVGRIRSEIRDLAEFSGGEISGTPGGPHPVTLTNVARRKLTVFLERPWPASHVARLRALASEKRVALQLIVGTVPPGHPAMVSWDALPGVLMELGQAAERAAASPSAPEPMPWAPR